MKDLVVLAFALLIAVELVTAHRLNTNHHRHKYGRRGHACLHGVKGICGEPSECTGKLKRGHCKSSSNVCCVSLFDHSGNKSLAPPVERPEKEEESQSKSVDMNDDYHDRLKEKQLARCRSKYFEYRRKNCVERVNKHFQSCKQYMLKPLHLAVADGTFERDFKTLVGMSVDTSIVKYKFLCKELTGSKCKPLTKDMVVDLFRNAESSKKILMKNPNIHWIYRIDVLNSNTAKTPEEARQRCFKKISKHKSVFHGLRNSKWVDLSGHMESIFTPEGKVVVDIKTMGTFNFFGPDMAAEHKAADVDPYWNPLSWKCVTKKRVDKYACGYGNYKEEFMKKWSELQKSGEILSNVMKKTFWRMFQSDPGAMVPNRQIDLLDPIPLLTKSPNMIA